MNWLRDVEPSPRLLVLPPAAVSLDEAHAAIEQWEYYSRKTLDPPQRLAVEVMMAETSTGRWAARTTGREEPRQNGKGDEVEVPEFWGITQRGEAIFHTAHELKTVAGAHLRMVGLLSHPDFSGIRKPRILNGLGQQAIWMPETDNFPAAVIQYCTRTSGGLRGLDDISRLVVDEAQHAQPEQLASATPTLLANPNPQMNFIGTGGIAGVSDWWWQQRIRALGPTLDIDPGDFGYVGHTAEKVHLERDADGRVVVVQEPVDPLDRDLWRLTNPALIYGRAEEAFLVEQLRLLGPALFAREHLGVWDPPPNPDGIPLWVVIPKDTWKARARTDFEPGPLRYALDVDTNEKGEEWASVSCSDGMLVEVVTPPDAPPGTDWVVGTLKTVENLGKLVVHKGSPAAKLADALERDGIEIEWVTDADFAIASQQFLDAVLGGGLVHLDQARLTRAVAGAARKDIGDGAWRFKRSLSPVDIGPLAGCLMARRAAVTTPDYDVLESVH